MKINYGALTIYIYYRQCFFNVVYSNIQTLCHAYYASLLSYLSSLCFSLVLFLSVCLSTNHSIYKYLAQYVCLSVRCA